MAEPASTATETEEGEQLRPFFYSLDEIPAHSIADMVGQMGADDEQAQFLYDVFGRDLMTKVILQSPNLSVFHEEARPGERVKPHRHGTHQITYVIRGSLHYGNRTTAAGQGYFSPDRPYAWVAGDDGAEWIEIHAGQPQIYAE